MELIYLWVEGYKNIEKQGFNFSPRFECKYNEDKNELTIKENDDYIPDFFGENINVTAIVGKNGSGKSSVFEFLNNGMYEYITNNQTKYQESVIVNKIILTYCKLKCKFNIHCKTSLNVKYYTDKTIKKIKENNEILLFNNNKSLSHLRETRNIINLIIKKNILFPFVIPEYISIGFHDNFSKFNEFIQVSSERLEIYGNKEEQLLAYEIYLMIAYLKQNQISCTDCNMNDLSLNMIIDKLREKIQDINIQDKIKKIIETIKNNFIFSKTHNSLLVKIEDLANDFIDNYHDIINFKESTDYGLNSHNDIILFEFFPKMSSGEEQFLRLFSALYEKFKKKFPYLICIDEGESFFHPNWQKQYTFYLINFFKDNFPNRKIHIILASHSPFLLSDIPKQNIIFLDTYTEEDIEVREEKQKIGNCKVLPHDKVLSIKQTFGANIHTLLTDSFFMEGGLMGEFAKQKINEIIKNLKDKEYRYTEKEKTKVLLIIESIGEPFLKSKLLDMYNRRFIDDYKIREQKRIDEQIRALQEKREQLK